MRVRFPPPAPLVFLFLIGLAGCTPYTIETVGPGTASVAQQPTVSGIYHRVEKGQTLWRISKVYEVELDQILSANRLSNAGQIEVGQQIFIPGATRLEEISSDRKLPAASTPQAFRVVPGEDFVWPVRGQVVSAFGSRTPHGPNKGINIQAQEGVNVSAARSGRVSFLDENLKGYGKTVIIDHGDQLSTVYTHLASIEVGHGEMVRQGQSIGTVGSTGRATAPFLHFEIRRRHRAENPYYYLS